MFKKNRDHKKHTPTSAQAHAEPTPLKRGLVNFFGEPLGQGKMNRKVFLKLRIKAGKLLIQTDTISQLLQLFYRF